MKKMTVLIAALFAFAAPLAAFAAMDHGGHGSMDMGHGGHQGDVAHEEVVDGVKATFKVMSMKEHMKAMKMEMPKELKETHHIAVEFKDAKTGNALTEGEVRLLDQMAGRPSSRSPPTMLSSYLTQIARLGGYLARASDSPPGNTVIWRGWSRLMDIKLGAAIAKAACG